MLRLIWLSSLIYAVFGGSAIDEEVLASTGSEGAPENSRLDLESETLGRSLPDGTAAAQREKRRHKKRHSKLCLLQWLIHR